MIKAEIIPEGFKQTSFGPIPSDWEVEELGSVVLEMKSGLSRELSNEDIGLPVIRSNNLIENEVDFNNIKYWYLSDNQGADTRNYYLTDGDILVNFINSVSQIGKCAYFKNLVNRPVIFTTNLLVVRFDMNKIDSRYFLYFSLQNHYNKFVESITKPAINQASFTTKDYKKLKLPLPPLPEQKAIAHVLSLMDSAINTNNQLIEKKELQKKWLMQNLLTGKKRLREFAGDWKEYHLGEMFSERNDTRYFDLPLLSVGASGIYPQSDSIKKDTSNEDKSKYKRICHGDIGYNTMRMWQGRSALSNLEGIVSPAYTIVKPKDNSDSLFFSYLFKTPKLMNLFWRNSQGLVDDTLNCKFKDFSIVKIQLPERKEQMAIAEVLQAADKEIKLLKSKTEKLRVQKKGLMQVLLTGMKRLEIKDLI
jgi:type I restriction enzyme S subunit